MNIQPKTKLRALGYKKATDIDPHVLNPKSIKLFSDPHSKNIRKNHGAQYFSQYLDLLKEDPKKAIWKDGMYLVFVIIEPITTEEYDIELIKSAFRAFYLNVNIEVLEEKLTLVKVKNQYFLLNSKLDVKVPIQSFCNQDNEKINLSSSNIIHAQRQLLRKYFQYTQQSRNSPLTRQNVFSSISLIDHPIVLECVPDNIITGRAQGYAGAVIGMKGCVQREIIATAIHECLHIFSIDHCVWWDCIMNFSYEFSDNYSEGGSFHLCPSCLSKIKYQLNFDIIERYRKLHEFFIMCNYKDDAAFIQKILKTF